MSKWYRTVDKALIREERLYDLYLQGWRQHAEGKPRTWNDHLTAWLQGWDDAAAGRAFNPPARPHTRSCTL